MTYSSQKSSLEKIEIPVLDGILLSGLLGRPKKRITNTKCRIVIFVHGFAAEKTENGLFLQAAESLVDQGYIVLAYDWRGLGESEGDFSDTDLQVHVRDFLAIKNWVEKETGVPPFGTCAVGFSLGATIVALGLKSGLLNLGSAVFWSPAINPSKSMWPRYNTNEFKHELETKGYIVKPENNVRIGSRFLASLKETDLGASVFKYDIPLLICHGTGDVRIPIDFTRLVCRMAGEKRNVNYYEFKDASHSFRPEQTHRDNLIYLLLEWLMGCVDSPKKSFQNVDPKFEGYLQKAKSSGLVSQVLGHSHHQT